MRHSLVFISTLFLSTLLFSQRKSTNKKLLWDDTTFVNVKLIDTFKKEKIITVDIGEKAIIYLSLKSVLKELKRLDTDNVKRIKLYLDSAFTTKDTIKVDNLSDFDYLVSDQLQSGNAKIYYKREKAFVSKISHRLEKYGMYSLRFFYLPDNRPFFSTMEYSGIIEKGKYLSSRGELADLYYKLSSEWKE